MNMMEKIQAMMDEKGYNKADVAKGTGIKYTTFDSMFKKGSENTGYPIVRKLAIFFDVSMEYLINDEVSDKNEGKIYHTGPLNSSEEQLVYLWRKLPHDEQMKILGRIEAKVEDYINSKPKLGDE